MDPMTWVYVIMLVVSLAMSLANRPKTRTPSRPPDRLDMPTRPEAREVKRSSAGSGSMTQRTVFRQPGTRPIRPPGAMNPVSGPCI